MGGRHSPDALLRSRRARSNGGACATPYLPSPYLELDREDWARLRRAHPLVLTDDDVARLTGLGESLNMSEIEEVYLPLSRLLSYYVEGTGHLHRITSNFLGDRPERTPFVIGVAGSVAVGKSTTARLLRELLARWPSTPRVELVTTDGFLFPNAELERRGLLHRKGFPESYDQRSLLRFVAEVKAGRQEVRAPIYSHLSYDIVRDQEVVVHRPDVLIVEGLNVLQAPRMREDGRTGLAVSDFFDFSVYVDANVNHIRRWYVERFLQLRQTAFAKPESYFHRYAAMTDMEARDTAEVIWRTINEPNLMANVLTTRGRATLVLTKGPDHQVTRVRLRKL